MHSTTSKRLKKQLYTENIAYNFGKKKQLM